MNNRRPRLASHHDPPQVTPDQQPVPPMGTRAAGEPCASWFCPDCGHPWISATGLWRKAWRCSACGHDTTAAAAAREAENMKRRTLERNQREAMIGRLLLLRAQGKSQRQAARELGTSIATINRIEKKRQT